MVLLSHNTYYFPCVSAINSFGLFEELVYGNLGIFTSRPISVRAIVPIRKRPTGFTRIENVIARVVNDI